MFSCFLNVYKYKTFTLLQKKIPEERAADFISPEKRFYILYITLSKSGLSLTRKVTVASATDNNFVISFLMDKINHDLSCETSAGR